MSEYIVYCFKMKFKFFFKIQNPYSIRGNSSSLRLKQYETDAYIVVIADQPYLKHETILGLLQCYLHRDKNMGSVITGTTPGDPTIFYYIFRLS